MHVFLDEFTHDIYKASMFMIKLKNDFRMF